MTGGSVPLSGWTGATGRPSDGTKAGSWGCVGSDPALVPDAASLYWWNGLTNKTSQAFPKEYVFESSSSPAHLGSSPEG